MATTPVTPKDPTAKPAEPSKSEKIGGPKDFIVIDDTGKPVEAIPADEIEKEQERRERPEPFRLEHKNVTYERAGEDEDGRATYRKVV
jgi:hypothetical protein